MAKKLSITIAGAVSLGCYEAGVLYELITALGQHNADPGTPEEQKIEIDVITGASAGGMTAAIAAQKLLFDANSLVKPYDNPLYHPWVTAITFENLIQLQATEKANHSLFSSTYINEISSTYLTDRYKGGQAPAARQKHAACADQLYLGLTLSNLNGYDYDLPLRPAGTFTYTCYQDQITLVHRNT